MSVLVDPPHKVRIVVESISPRADGSFRTNSRTTHEEFADTEEELVGKAFGLTRGVVDGTFAGAEKLAAPYLKGGK